MANGETCGIKVQTPVNKANITNSMLRGVKQQIIKECDLQSAVRSAVCGEVDMDVLYNPVIHEN